jgi:hypothetical protein
VIRLAGTVIYLDGRSEPFTGGPREWVAWEHYALSKGLPTAAADPQHAAALTMTWFLAWACATKGVVPRPGFETWLEAIAEVSGFELEDVPPTLTAASLEPSSGLLSPPADQSPSSTASSRASSPPSSSS